MAVTANITKKGKEMETKRKYSWDRRSYGVKPEVVGAVFERLEAEYGEVTPENLLKEAEPEDSPIHKLFEWNDEKAAALYRRGQSQKIILDLRVEVEAEGEKFNVPAYVNVVSGDARSSYQNVIRSFQVAETRDIILARAYNELETFRLKYAKFQTFARLIDEIDSVLSKR